MAKNQKKTEVKINSFSELDSRQKSDLAEWLYELYRESYVKSGLIPDDVEMQVIIQKMIIKIRQAGIMIADKPVRTYCTSKQMKLQKRLQKEFPDNSEE